VARFLSVVRRFVEYRRSLGRAIERSQFRLAHPRAPHRPWSNLGARLLLYPRLMQNKTGTTPPEKLIERRTPPHETAVLIISMTSIAAVQVLTLLLATHLEIKRDYWADPIPARPPFIVRLASHLSTATLGVLHAAVDTIPDAVMC